MSRLRAALALAGLAVTMTIVALLFTGSAEPVRTELNMGRPMFPQLDSQLSQVRRIEILHQGRTLALMRGSAGWVLPDHADYPVQQEPVRALLTSLAGLRLQEERTSDPDAFGRLGLDNPASPDAISISVRLMEADGTPVASVITGSVPTEGSAPDAIYARRPDETRTWLASGWLGASADWRDWINPTIADVLPENIVTVVSQRIGGPRLTLARQNGSLLLTEPVDHPVLDRYKLQDMARVLSDLNLLDVVRAADMPGALIGDTALIQNEGSQLHLQVSKAGDAIWVRALPGGLPSNLSAWAFRVPASKEQALLPTLADLSPFRIAAMPPPLPAKQTAAPRTRRK